MVSFADLLRSALPEYNFIDRDHEIRIYRFDQFGKMRVNPFCIVAKLFSNYTRFYDIEAEYDISNPEFNIDELISDIIGADLWRELVVGTTVILVKGL